MTTTTTKVAASESYGKIILFAISKNTILWTAWYLHSGWENRLGRFRLFAITVRLVTVNESGNTRVLDEYDDYYDGDDGVKGRARIQFWYVPRVPTGITFILRCSYECKLDRRRELKQQDNKRGSVMHQAYCKSETTRQFARLQREWVSQLHPPDIMQDIFQSSSSLMKRTRKRAPSLFELPLRFSRVCVCVFMCDGK